NIKKIYELANWYQDFKPEQKHITVSPATLKAIRARKYPNIYIREDGVHLGEFLLTL
ncbi:unnamed protein product, partial [marine sediment metagenome]